LNRTISQLNTTATYNIKSKDVSGALRPYTSLDGEMGASLQGIFFKEQLSQNRQQIMMKGDLSGF